MENIVFIAQSLDGYIAGKNGELDWLNAIPNPENIDMGYTDFMNEIDAIVMGRNTFDTVCHFEGPWPYTKPVFVLSHSLSIVPEDYIDKVRLLDGSLNDILSQIHKLGYYNLYIDGGKTIQNFLKHDLIDRFIITTIPIILGDGIPLFTVINQSLEFNHLKTTVFLDQLVQSEYRRKS